MLNENRGRKMGGERQIGYLYTLISCPVTILSLLYLEREPKVDVFQNVMVVVITIILLFGLNVFAQNTIHNDNRHRPSFITLLNFMLYKGRKVLQNRRFGQFDNIYNIVFISFFLNFMSFGQVIFIIYLSKRRGEQKQNTHQQHHLFQL